MLEELLALSQALQRCHDAAKDAGDRELSDALHEMGWAAMRLIFQRLRDETAKKAS